MTTHKDTTEQQYHRAPLNGLIIGTTVGAAWDTVFVMSYVNSQEAIDPKEYPSLLALPNHRWKAGLKPPVSSIALRM
ncbi:hypothetical protein V7G09_11040 [Cutibacterium avidum]|uniref:hypothetical protein n=1 Tax=Cutibacterium avidum TaxID=33010 RepID=UPI002FF3BA3B